MTITNGTIKYGQTVKTGDFENKRCDVELAFKVEEGEDVNTVIDHVSAHAHMHAHRLLNTAPAKATPAATTEQPTAAPKPPKAARAAPKPPAAPVAEAPAASAADVVEEPASVAKAPEAESAAEVVDDDLSDILGEPASTEITDKEIMDATQAHQQKVKNGPAIKKLLGDLGVKQPPGRVIDLPQAKRKEYLEKLVEIKPLA